MTALNFPFAIFETSQVKSKSNFRRSSSTSKWSDISSFESEVAILARQARPSTWEVDDQKRVADRPVVVAVIIARTMLDTGNLSKSILDGAEGVLFTNDASVAMISEYAERSRTDQKAVVAFGQLPAGSSRHDIAEATTALFAVAEDRFAEL